MDPLRSGRAAVIALATIAIVVAACGTTTTSSVPIGRRQPGRERADNVRSDRDGGRTERGLAVRRSVEPSGLVRSDRPDRAGDRRGRRVLGAAGCRQRR